MIGNVHNGIQINNARQENKLNTSTQNKENSSSFAQMLSMMNAKTLEQASSDEFSLNKEQSESLKDNAVKASDIKDEDISNLMSNLPSSTRNLLQSLNLENSQLKGILANMYTADELAAFTNSNNVEDIDPVTAMNATQDPYSEEMLEDSEIMNRLQNLFTHNAPRYNEADDYIELINSSKSYL